MSKLVELLRQLVAIDSINPDLVPGGSGEENIARFVADWLQRAGLEVYRDEPVPGRPSIIGIARGIGGGRSLMLNAHMDTVGVVGMDRPHDPYIQDNRLYGRGAYDMKGGLAAIMAAGAATKQLSLRGDVIVTAVADEEYASIGTSSIVKKNWHADAAIVTEPTELNICIAHKGFIWLEVETMGVAAHGSLPELGLDAIAKMGKVLVGLEELDHRLRSAPSHPLLKSGSVHASLIEGGQELSSYPKSCILGVERRTIPGETQRQVETELPTIFEHITASDPNFKATVKTLLVRDAFEISEDELIVQTLRRHATALSGREPEVIGHTAWMDSAILSSASIPTVVFGPGGEGAHAVVEWSDLKQVERCVAVLTEVAKEFCG